MREHRTMVETTSKHVPRGQISRQRILDAAIEMFAERGYRSTGLLAIAERVGITHGTILYHFKTKQNLLLAVIEERQRIDHRHFEELLAIGGLQALAALPAVAHRGVAQPQSVRLFSVLVSESLDPDDPLHGYFVNRYAYTRDGVETMIRVGQQRGEIHPDIDPVGIGEETLAFVIGIQTQWLLDPERVDIVAAYERFSSALVARLRVVQPD